MHPGNTTQKCRLIQTSRLDAILNGSPQEESQMKAEDILAQPARVLTQAQRQHYFNHGFVGVEELVPEET